jgi:hypothetical protein
MMQDEGWIVDDKFKELIDIFAMENHHVMARMLSYAIEVIQYEFDGEEGSIYIVVDHDPENGTRTIDVNVRIPEYKVCETDPVTHDWLPGTFEWRLDKIRKNIDRKFPYTYSRYNLDVGFLVTSDHQPSETKHTTNNEGGANE